MADRVIHILPEFLANQIAAGEVVQRPESVVKELVENALDAGASHVTVVVRQAGKSLIHVIDNGCGMSREDLELSLKRHATSKIRTQEDLERIQTLGFRGEALASIGSVAQVEIKTRREADEHGWVLESEPMREVHIRPERQECGTQVMVRNLFFNIPARRKFLRSDATEFRHISDTMTRFALSYPDRRFTFFDAESQVFDVRPGTVEDRIAELFGDTVRASIVPVDLRTELIHVYGFVGKPNIARTTRSQQFLFLNHRTIASKSISHAVMQGFEHLIEKTQFPMYVLNIELDPAKIDVNVHPQKTEVKFDNDRAVYDIVHEAVLQALRASNLVPEVRFRDEHAPQSFERLRLGPGADYRPTTTYVNEETGEIIERVADRPYERPYERQAASPLYASAFDALFYSEDEVRMRRAAADGQTEAQTQNVAGSQGPIWQLHNKYIFVQTPEGMIVVDQHIAHERILYERALAAISNGLPYSQRLLFPVNVSMSVSERSALDEVREEIRELGFELETSGADVRVVSVPLDVRSGEESSALIEILEQFNEYKQVRAAESRDNLAASFACRASIKAGDPLSVAEMRKLVDDLFATAVPEVCPHGRPVLVRFDLKEFDRRFGRTS
ncbi:MAG: DNA mismatch repair endonuclease MutL [Candidatus Kapaibacterium sp.]|jgi:DNA mismatch repair protein MutL